MLSLLSVLRIAHLQKMNGGSRTGRSAAAAGIDLLQCPKN
jgi:hypothetical protein